MSRIFVETCSFAAISYFIFSCLARTEELRKSFVTLKMATRLKKVLGSCWKDVGAFLEIFEDELDSIEKSNKSDQEKAGAMLKLWRDWKGTKATVGDLEDVCNQLGKKRIAEMLLGT